MSYTYKKGKRWYIGFINEQGQPDQEATAARTKTEAKRIAGERELLAERLRTGIEKARPAPMTFTQLAERYMRDVTPLRRSRVTLDGHIQHHLEPFFGQQQLGRISPADVQQFIAEKSKVLHPQTVEHLRSTLRAMFYFALAGQNPLTVGSNPATEVTEIKIPKGAIRVVDPRHIPALLAVLPARWRALFAATIYTGARRSELFALTPADVDVVKMIISVSKSGTGATKSGEVRGGAHPPGACRVLGGAARARWAVQVPLPQPQGGHALQAHRPRGPSASSTASCRCRCGLPPRLPQEGLRLRGPR
jgi:integrase